MIEHEPGTMVRHLVGLADSSGAQEWGGHREGFQVGNCRASVEPQTLGGKIVEPSPQQPIEGENVEAQYADAESDAGAVAGGGGAGDIGADARRGQYGVPPLHDFGNDARIP